NGPASPAIYSILLPLALHDALAISFGSRGDAYRKLGRHDEALADFARAVEMDPPYAWAFAGRAAVYEALGRHEEALADYDRALEIDPLYEWAVGSRAQLFE
ncbi:tetratricopeptide repeat protein, partial [Streptomyces sp. JV181]|uniref:tetratricopeptide repeat protein n=1 Tax=Streptomyces sp. JV181 TaxID=858635 RepID=UPI002E77ACFF